MSPLPLTIHARARMQQRGIRAETLEALLDFGRFSRGPGGCDIVFFDRRSRKTPGFPPAGRRGRAYAIVGPDGAVITVGHRYRRLARL